MTLIIWSRSLASSTCMSIVVSSNVRPPFSNLFTSGAAASNPTIAYMGGPSVPTSMVWMSSVVSLASSTYCPLESTPLLWSLTSMTLGSRMALAAELWRVLTSYIMPRSMGSTLLPKKKWGSRPSAGNALYMTVLVVAASLSECDHQSRTLLSPRQTTMWCASTMASFSLLEAAFVAELAAANAESELAADVDAEAVAVAVLALWLATVDDGFLFASSSPGPRAPRSRTTLGRCCRCPPW